MEYIDRNKEKIIEDLSKCISYASISYDKEKIEEALDYVLALASEMGMRTQKLLDGRIGVVEIGSGDETFGILVHIDVVNEGDRSLWICDPFKGIIKDDRIYGRGALDDKGPLIACLHAMKAAAEEKEPFTKKVRMIIGTQEEVEWSDIEDYVRLYEMPDYGFTPDGEFPICNIEKGCVDAVLRFPFSEGDSREGLKIEKIQGGTAVNIVPDKCTIWLSDGRTIETSGKATHSSRPENGENAILKMASAVNEMDICGQGLSEKIKMIHRRFADIYGKNVGLYSQNEYYNGEFIHRTIIMPTMIKSGDGYIDVWVNIRFSYETDEEKVIASLEQLCKDEGGEIRECCSLPAVYVDRNEPFLKRLADAYEKETGLKNEFSLAYGGSYAKSMKKIVSWGPVLPGMEDTCHEENEYIKIEDLLLNFRIYYRAIIQIAKSEESFK